VRDIELQRLNHLVRTGQQHLLAGGLIGLEKESLRLRRSDGLIAQTPHPESLGAALTHPYITTDYSEALLEFITPPLSDSDQALDFLHELHGFVHRRLDDELLWAASMPCVVAGEDSIPIARYGSSNQGRFKYIYRVGLGHRYGKVMQVIAGMHFNYSLPEALWPVLQDLERDRDLLREFISDRYFGLIRNLQRHSWLLLYLFGASPAVCKSFLRGQSVSLPEYDANTWYGPHATSLRMSDIGYTNRKRCALRVNNDSPASYIDSLIRAVHQPCAPYQAIGVEVGGEYRQLSDKVLQIEDEFYSVMRPKQIPEPGERPLEAMMKRGVRYVELRSSDLDVFEPAGMGPRQPRFLEAFLIYCLLADSPPISADEQSRIDYNQLSTARQGRDPELRLWREDGDVSLTAWGLEICSALEPICEVLDRDRSEPVYRPALAAQAEALRDTERTPSARVLAAMRDQGVGFYHFAKARSEHFHQQYLSSPMDPKRERILTELASESRRRQHILEQAEQPPFDEFLAHYLERL
jgi:glutamate--cysteine ligase